MPTLTSLLTDIGLDTRDATIYLALLELGETTVLPLAKQAGIKRTYCYDILASLQERGLVSYVERNGRRRYSAQPPEVLQKVARERLEKVTALIPELKLVAKKAESQPIVQYFEGKTGVKAVYEQLVGVPSFDAITSPTQMYEHLGDFFPGFAKRVLKKKIVIRELLAGPVPDTTYVDLYTEPDQQSRRLPDAVNLTTDIVLFGNKLALISYGRTLHAVVIESGSIVDTHRQLFEVLWQQAGSHAPRTFSADQSKQSSSFEDEA